MPPYRKDKWPATETAMSAMYAGMFTLLFYHEPTARNGLAYAVAAFTIGFPLAIVVEHFVVRHRESRAETTDSIDFLAGELEELKGRVDVISRELDEIRMERAAR